MKYQVGNGANAATVDLDQATLIGKGGEAAVHMHPNSPNDIALKIYRDVDGERVGKLKAMLRGQIPFTPLMTGPLDLVYQVNPSGGTPIVAGFSMHRLPTDVWKWRRLTEPSFCNNNGFTTKVVAGLSLRAGADLVQIHSWNINVGDLNDGGLMVSPSGILAWVDVDSWDTPNYPCRACTMYFISPDLYGTDFSKGRYYKPDHDWYSYAVLVFSALLRKHPFRAGTCDAHPGPTERASLGLTVLDKEVIYPPVGLKPEVMSDDLITALLASLKRQNRGPFPLDVLKHYQEILVECKSCHQWFPSTRKNCPQCSTVAQVPVPPPIGVTIRAILETRGRFIYMQVLGERVLAIAEELSRYVYYEYIPGQPVKTIALPFKLSSPLRFAFFADCLAVVDASGANAVTAQIAVYRIAGSSASLLERASTRAVAGIGPVYGASERFLYHALGNMLMATRALRTGTAKVPVAQIYGGQCQYWVDRGSDNAESLLWVNHDVHRDYWSVSRGTNGGTVFVAYQLDVPDLQRQESLLDVQVSFHGDSVLLIRRTRQQGKDMVRLEQISILNGRVEKSEVLDCGKFPDWDSIRGKAYRQGSIMHPTDQGIKREKLVDHLTDTLPGTAVGSSSDDRLVPYHSGLLVRRLNKVLFVTK